MSLEGKGIFMLQTKNLSKSYGTRTLFSNVTFSLNRGERVGLVGRNGQGKTTLLRIIQGEESYDGGELTFPKNYRIGYLRQHLKMEEKTLLQEACMGLPEEEKDHHYKVEKILFGLGFTKDDLQRSPLEFSGGYQIRVHLTKALLSQPDLLLLDEPTNYLDILALRWLTRFLQNWKTELILISHDRGFMDQVCTHTMGVHRGMVKKVPGATLKYYEQLQLEEEIHEKARLNEEKEMKQMEDFINRFRAKASKASVVQSRIKAYEKKEVKEKLPSMQNLDFSFSFVPCAGKTYLKLENGAFSYSGLSSDYLMQNLNFQVGQGDRIGIIGKNGRGKSTLLKILARELQLTEGQLQAHPQMKFAYFGQTNIERLNLQLTVEEEVKSQCPDLPLSRVRGICGTMLFSGDDAQKKIAVLSGGEKSRVLLGKILSTPANILLLDEPTNHLDMESVESLMDALEDFPGAVFLVTHNEMLLKRVVSKLIVFRAMPQSGLKREVLFFDGFYEDFLKKIGWEDENGLSAEVGEGLPAKIKVGSKEYKQIRSELIRERAKNLNPLKKEQERIESRIMELEDVIKDFQQKLIDRAQQNSGDAISVLSKTLKQAEEEIDILFHQLEGISTELTEKEKFYDGKLRELDQA